MSGFSHLRSDRGSLAPPISATIYEGRVARVHKPGDALIYSTGPEHRDVDELANIVSQLPELKVYLGHPSVYPASASDQKVVGYVESGRMDDDTAIARIVITDQEALDAIEAGTHELSLGYQCSLSEDRYQKNVVLDHLAIVDRARCGASCAMRTDMLAPIVEENVKVGTLELEVKVSNLEELTRATQALQDALTVKVDGVVPVPDETSATCTCKNHTNPYNTGEPMSDTKNDLSAEMEALKAKLEEANKALTALEIEATNARKDADKAKSDLEALKTEVESVKADAAASVSKAKLDAEEALKTEIDARVEKRVALVSEAKEILGNTDISKMSDRDIKVAVIKHVDGDDVPADKSVDYVDGVYAGALKRGAKAGESRTAARVTINEMRKDNAPLKGIDAERAAKENMKRESAQAWSK